MQLALPYMLLACVDVAGGLLVPVIGLSRLELSCLGNMQGMQKNASWNFFFMALLIFCSCVHGGTVHVLTRLVLLHYVTDGQKMHSLPMEKLMEIDQHIPVP